MPRLEGQSAATSAETSKWLISSMATKNAWNVFHRHTATGRVGRYHWEHTTQAFASRKTGAARRRHRLRSERAPLRSRVKWLRTRGRGAGRRQRLVRAVLRREARSGAVLQPARARPSAIKDNVIGVGRRDRRNDSSHLFRS